MRPDFYFGIAVMLGGLAIAAYGLRPIPKMTRFEWDVDGSKYVEYMAGDISADQLKTAGIWPATQHALIKREVMRMPQPGDRAPE